MHDMLRKYAVNEINVAWLIRDLSAYLPFSYYPTPSTSCIVFLSVSNYKGIT